MDDSEEEEEGRCRRVLLVVIKVRYSSLIWLLTLLRSAAPSTSGFSPPSASAFPALARCAPARPCGFGCEGSGEGAACAGAGRVEEDAQVSSEDEASEGTTDTFSVSTCFCV